MPDPNIHGGSRPIEDVLVELGKEVPPEEWAKVPVDLSSNLDHYLYGTPRNTPNIRGGTRTICTAAIVLACILAVGLAMILLASFPSSEASAGLLVGASCLLG